MTDMAFTGTGQLIHYHPAEVCSGTPCPLHNPSDHHMRTWPLHLRTDIAWYGGPPLMERRCEHGIGHPDPDTLEWLHRCGQYGYGTHGCDGCCHE